MRPTPWAGWAARPRRRRRGIVPAVVTAVALAASLSVGTAARSSAAPGSFTISPTAGPPGTTVQITGTCGFAAQTVSFGVFGEPETFDFYVPVTSTDGSFTRPLLIPATAPVGSTWPVGVVCDLGKPTQADLGQQAFTVQAGAAGPAPLYAVKLPGTPKLIPGFWISPTAGPVGTTITITGFCGYPADNLSYSLTYPDATNLPIPSVYVLGEKLPPSDLGQFSVQLKVPAQGLTIPQYPGPNPVLPGIHHVNASCDYLSGGQSVDLARRDFEVTPATAKKPTQALANGAFTKVWLATTGLFLKAELPFATQETTPEATPDGEAPPEETTTTTTTTTTASPGVAPAPAPEPAPEPQPSPTAPCSAGVPVPVAPVGNGGRATASNPPTFQWSYTDPCPAQSFVVVVTDAHGAQVASGTVGGTQWTSGRLPPNALYSWKVAAVHDGAQGPFSTTNSFYIL